VSKSDSNDIQPFYEEMGLVPQTPSSVKDLLRACMVCPREDGDILCIVGVAGIGKSEIPKQVASEMSEMMGGGYGFTAFYVPVTPAEDMAGIPVVSDDRTSFKKLPLDSVKRAIEKYPNGGIICVEELNRAADDDTLQAVFALISTGMIGDFKIPDSWIFMANINPSAADSDYEVKNVNKDPAWVRRLCFVAMVPNVEDWLAWAREAKVHPRIIDFIISNPETLLDKDAAASGKAFPNPAAWAQFSSKLKAWDDKKIAVGTRTMRTLLAGKIGVPTANQFMEFWAGRITSLNPKEILLSFADEKSEIRKTAEQLLADDENGIIAASAEAAIRTLMDSLMDPVETTVCENLMAHWSFLEEDSRAAAMSCLLHYRQNGTPDQKSYINSLMRHLSKGDNKKKWVALLHAVGQAHTEIAKLLETSN
jgi:hypothetical protein